MTSHRYQEAIDAVMSMTIPHYRPIKGLVSATLGVSGEWLDRAQEQWLLEAIPYLFKEIERRASLIRDDLKREMSSHLYEMIMQVLVDLKHTADREKRRRLVNVLVNGIRDPWEVTEHQFMVHSVREMSPLEINILQGNVEKFSIKEAGFFNESRRKEVPNISALERGGLRRLVMRGFVEEEIKIVPELARGIEYRRTHLGDDVIEYIRDLHDGEGIADKQEQ